jgi:hypothetical protein
LEFDSMLVIEEGMSVNEKYIAYTRTLDNLIILCSGDREDPI